MELVRPETRQAILKLCAQCTKTDVALNNLVVRARTQASEKKRSLLQTIFTFPALNASSIFQPFPMPGP
jgi:hypothetical protein